MCSLACWIQDKNPLVLPQTAQTLQPRDLSLKSVRLLRVTDGKIAFRPESLLQSLPPQPDKMEIVRKQEVRKRHQIGRNVEPSDCCNWSYLAWGSDDILLNYILIKAATFPSSCAVPETKEWLKNAKTAKKTINSVRTLCLPFQHRKTGLQNRVR